MSRNKRNSEQILCLREEYYSSNRVKSVRINEVPTSLQRKNNKSTERLVLSKRTASRNYVLSKTSRSQHQSNIKPCAEGRQVKRISQIEIPVDNPRASFDYNASAKNKFIKFKRVNKVNARSFMNKPSRNSTEKIDSIRNQVYHTQRSNILKSMTRS